MPCVHLLPRRRVSAGEMVCLVVMLHEQRLVMRQCVLFPEQPPDLVLVVRAAAIELVTLQFRELVYQPVVDDKLHLPVLSRRFVPVAPDTLLEEFGHFKVRIAQQCRNAHDGSKHLRQERTATVPYQQIGTIPVTEPVQVFHCFFGAHGQVWSQDFNLSVERLFQRQCRDATAGSEEAVQE